MLKQIIIFIKPESEQDQINRQIQELSCECRKKEIDILVVKWDVQWDTQWNLQSEQQWNKQSEQQWDLQSEQQEKKIQYALQENRRAQGIPTARAEECLLLSEVEFVAAFADFVTSNVPLVGIGLNYSGKCGFLIENLQYVDLRYLSMVYDRYHHNPVTIAETEHLIIREMAMDDLDALYELYDTLKDCEFVEPLYERAEEEEFSENYIKNMYGFFGYGLWLLFRKEDQKLIGRAGIGNREIDYVTEQELGYLIGKPWQKQHYAQEACEEILRYAREELEIEKMFLCTDQKNEPSISLAHKLGFVNYAEDIDGMNIYYKDLTL